MFSSLFSVLGTTHPKTTPTESLVLYNMYKIVCPGILYIFFSWFFLLLLSMFVYSFLGGKEPARFYGSTAITEFVYSCISAVLRENCRKLYHERTDDGRSLPAMVSQIYCWTAESLVILYKQCPPHCWTAGSRTVSLELCWHWMTNTRTLLNFRTDGRTAS